MPDVVFIALMLAFFALSVGLIRFCERMARGEQR